MRLLKARSLAEILSATSSSENRDICYRGHSNSCWTLVPTLYRALVDADVLREDAAWIARCEKDIYREFEQRGRALFDLKDGWEILFLAQHHGVPTRLLDWTKNILVALFFAVASSETTDAAVWCLDLSAYPFPTSLGRRHREGGHRLDNIREYCNGLAPSFMQRVTHTFTGSAARPKGTLVAVEPPAIDSRIEQQESIFTIYLSFEDDDLQWDHLSHLAEVERQTEHHVLTKIEIPSEAKTAIRKQLEDQMRMSIYRLFPDLAGLGKWLSDENRTQFYRELKKRPKTISL